MPDVDQEWFGAAAGSAPPDAGSAPPDTGSAPPAAPPRPAASTAPKVPKAAALQTDFSVVLERDSLDFLSLPASWAGLARVDREPTCVAVLPSTPLGHWRGLL